MTFLLRDGQLVTSAGVVRADLALEEDRIVEIAASIRGRTGEELDLRGAFVFPGFVDAHVHFNEPGRADWEGITSGSRAFSVGGGTVFCDMPLNSDPPVLSAVELMRKRAVAEEKSVTDFALWGGLCPGTTDRIPEMAAAGAMGFKAFLCASGIEEFPAADARTLREGMRRAAEVGLPVGVHAEDPAVLAEAARLRSDESLRSFFATRPKEAEVAAVRMACEVAGETGAALHVVHVTCLEALEAIDAAKAAGVDVTAETCPHYLLFDADAAGRIGARAKCAPPLREAADVEALWAALAKGLVDTIGTDHSPAPPEQKTGMDFFRIWGGVSGCQHGLPAFLGEWHHRFPHRLPEAAAWLSGTPARRFRLKGKGTIEVGADADLTVVEFGEPRDPAVALYRHKSHLYEFHRPRCAVVHVLRRGEYLVRSGWPVSPSGRGCFLQPTLSYVPSPK